MHLGSSRQTDGGEIIPLTSIRGVAALWVVALHLSANLPFYLDTPPPPLPIARLLAGGNFAVDMFFVLSGYVITKTYGTQAITAAFLRNRVARIFPLHLAVASAVVFYILVIDHGGIIRATRNEFPLYDLPLYFTLTFVWFGIKLPSIWNLPIWSLSAELVAYLLFPAIQLMLRHGALALVLAGLLVTLWLQHRVLAVTGYQSTGIIAIGRSVLGFAVGALLCQAGKPRHPPGWLADPALAALVLCFILGHPALAVFPSALLILCLGLPGNGLSHRLLATRPAHAAGKISFSIYIVHIPLLFLATLVPGHTGIRRHAADAWGFVPLYLIALLVVSAFTYKFIEQPGRHFVRRLF